MEGNTIFHKIIRKEIPAKIVYEDDKMIAFHDIQPAAPVHVLLVPKVSLSSVHEAKPEQAAVLGHLLVKAGELAQQFGLTESGYRLVINSGPHGGQTVFQLHVHLLGERPLSWPPG